MFIFVKGGEFVCKIVCFFEVVCEVVEFVLYGLKVCCEFFVVFELWVVEVDKG